ncbi:putative phage abortive infection protein [Elizabethkingia anophelis]|uniref:putative phage abortive infection protein n=1 Tax=Elizabethkingia anophelis TaxID=1117645 RepID=UPI0009D73D83|nr:putative phage abortive infection protein [Elizabethkingia anophelis]MCT3803339.1 hypothetical protein [Elizabethkingia anophelis]MCT3982161.1 hypothetical protein [Elizabethkingia anophelis]MCT4060170.1 hypothetical protein [Elizabethkingia anophelis]MCT4070861.1 hypothetical protein [Elizabethkingia anophelis]MCT4120810.1 hypothetical protein [Elizabethkingia anophelis]
MKFNFRIIFSVMLTIIGFSIILWFIIRGIYTEDFINSSNKINLERSSQFGDFIGGSVGTIFSFVGVILLFETLSLQRKEFKSSNDVFTHQQFDNTFFELLNFHKENVKAFKTYTITGELVTGRDFLTYQKEYLQDIFIPTRSLSKNRKKAIELFRILYVQYEENFSLYFKTLYQLYSLIKDSKIDGELQARYSKMLRAQLSDAELFFIRYNAMTELGLQSSSYINIFNILKHLSHFDLLEFKFWWSQLSKFERNGLNTIIKEIKSIMKSFLIDDEYNTITRDFKKGRYKITLISEKRSEFLFDLSINYSKNSIDKDITDGLECFTNEEIENLFKCIFKEFFFYSNFNTYNNPKNLKIDRFVSTNNLIQIKVHNLLSERIKVHYWYE